MAETCDLHRGGCLVCDRIAEIDRLRASLAAAERDRVADAEMRLQLKQARNEALEALAAAEARAKDLEARAVKAEGERDAAHVRNYEDQDEASAIAARLAAERDAALRRLEVLPDAKDKVAYQVLGRLAVDEKARHERLEEIQRSIIAARNRHQRFTTGQLLFAAMVGMGAGVYAGVWVALELLLAALR